MNRIARRVGLALAVAGMVALIVAIWVWEESAPHLAGKWFWTSMVLAGVGLVLLTFPWESDG